MFCRMLILLISIQLKKIQCLSSLKTEKSIINLVNMTHLLFSKYFEGILFSSLIYLKM